MTEVTRSNNNETLDNVNKETRILEGGGDPLFNER